MRVRFFHPREGYQETDMNVLQQFDAGSTEIDRLRNEVVSQVSALIGLVYFGDIPSLACRKRDKTAHWSYGYQIDNIQPSYRWVIYAEKQVVHIALVEGANPPRNPPYVQKELWRNDQQIPLQHLRRVHDGLNSLLQGILGDHSLRQTAERVKTIMSFAPNPNPN